MAMSRRRDAPADKQFSNIGGAHLSARSGAYSQPVETREATRIGRWPRSYR
jgi:hypothetical protein